MGRLHRLTEDPRVRLRNRAEPDPVGRSVLYWMQRAQRAEANPALETAVRAARTLERPLVVLFQLVPGFPGATERHYAFLLEGLVETAATLEDRGIPFRLRLHAGDPAEGVAAFGAEAGAALVVSDENPLREPEGWRIRLAERLTVPFLTVDADVVVPSALFPKLEYAARTLRPRLHRQLEAFLQPVRTSGAPPPWSDPGPPGGEELDVDRLLDRLRPDRASGRLTGIRAGTAAARAELEDFVTSRLRHYHEHNRRPEHAAGTSRLSPWLHFGQLSVLEAALAARRADVPAEAREAFLEQLIVRRELAVNFVRHEPAYDRWEGLPEWSRRTLHAHRRDRRPYLYTIEELESAATHDPLWNAGMTEMKTSGFMHGYVRMYWAKKILHWSADPETALQEAITLNDRWLVDGRDPNGYTNIAWSIGGRHDRPWTEREVFGQVRYMSFESTSRKFDHRAYARRVGEAVGGSPTLFDEAAT
jgi:deoxyribodipyrimidine photo-lyase